MNSDDTNVSNKKEEKWILFCPYCHSTRIKVKNPNVNEICRCHKCKSTMKWFMAKDNFDAADREKKVSLVKDLKADYPNAATPTEILLGRIDDSLWTIKSILQFYLLLTILGIFAAVIMFLN